MNYAALTAAIQQYCSNTESTFVANIPVFVKAAEQRIYNAVQLPVLRKSVTGTFTANTRFLSLPTDWLATFEIAVQVESTPPGNPTQAYLLPKDVSFIRESFPASTITGVPQYYAQFDKDTLLIGPTPDSNYTVEMHYFYYPTSIVDDGTSWLGDNFDTVLLYGALREAYLFMKGEEDIVKYYEQMYTESLGLLKQLAEGKNRRDDFRDGKLKKEVQ